MDASRLTIAGIFIASIIGSWHCAGMCGPFSLLISRTRNRAVAYVLYHLGRLAAYLMLALGFHTVAQKIMGGIAVTILAVLVVLWGALIVFEWKGASREPTWNLPGPLKTAVGNSMRRGGAAGAAAIGLLTGLLPCVWLYGFVFAAAAQPRPVDVSLTVISFWLGTLPALFLTQMFFRKFRGKMRWWSRRGAVLFVLAVSLFSLFTHAGILKESGQRNGCPLHATHQ